MRQESNPKDNFRSFRKHLNYADLIICFGFIPVKLVVKKIDRFYGGICLCKILAFFQPLGFYLCSNFIAAIAVDRVFGAKNLRRATNTRSNRFVGQILWVSCWLLAILCSIPNVFLYALYDLGTENENNFTNASKLQCISQLFFTDDTEMFVWGDR